MQYIASLGMIYSNIRSCHGSSGKNATEVFCQAATPEPLYSPQRPAEDWQGKKLTGPDVAILLFGYYD